MFLNLYFQIKGFCETLMGWLQETLIFQRIYFFTSARGIPQITFILFIFSVISAHY